MTFSQTEKRVVAIGIKLSIVLGFVACLGLVGSWFMGRPIGPKVMAGCGCGLSLALVSALYLGVCQFVIDACGKREGA
ncbi:hypothetical protein [Caulobacter sp. FWC26]|uniref:hypothetical protein n=1 Tax=Caulobacter sp. FWC26 TaxID=69665 RepID=UPI000C155969|nr:hypothetical protein [Caulobacter sp. FWC26]AZS19209.1 hypothetical protein CSW63_00290 [Caulobacter sp. FWC26]